MPEIRDVIVIGSGPAGLACATEVGKAGLSCLTVDPQGPGGQLINLGVLQDLPDVSDGTTGPDFLGLLVDRASEAGVEIGFGEVKGVSRSDDGLWLVHGDEETWLARAVIIATGLTKGTTGLPDESAYEGRGVSHCAVCDGPLYKNKSVAVYGEGRWVAVEAKELAEYASAVTVIGATHDERVAGLPSALPHVTLMQGRVAGLRGGAQGLTSVAVVQDGGSEIEVLTQGVFLLAGRRPATAFLADLLRQVPDGAILVARDTQETSCAGIYACGDVESPPADGIGDAIANGIRAGHNAVRWVKSRVAG